MNAREVLVKALQWAWNDFCNDTGEYPGVLYRQGRKLYAEFDRGNFVSMAVDRLAADGYHVCGEGEGVVDGKRVRLEEIWSFEGNGACLIEDLSTDAEELRLEWHMVCPDNGEPLYRATEVES